MSARRLWALKTKVIDPLEETPAMRRGRILEDSVLRLVQETHPDWAVMPNQIYYRDPAIRLGATPDAFAILPNGRRRCLQLKTVAKHIYENDWEGECPAYYQLQNLAEMSLTDSDDGEVAVMIIGYAGDLELAEYELERHEQAEAEMRRSVRAFWDAIERGEEPPFEYDKDLELVKHLKAPLHADPIDLTQDNRMRQICRDRLTIKAKMKLLEDELKATDAEIIAKLDGHQAAILPGYKVTNKIQHRASYQVKATSFPVLRVTVDEKEGE